MKVVVPTNSYQFELSIPELEGLVLGSQLETTLDGQRVTIECSANLRSRDGIDIKYFPIDAEVFEGATRIAIRVGYGVVDRIKIEGKIKAYDGLNQFEFFRQNLQR